MRQQFIQRLSFSALYLFNLHIPYDICALLGDFVFSILVENISAENNITACKVVLNCQDRKDTSFCIVPADLVECDWTNVFKYKLKYTVSDTGIIFPCNCTTIPRDVLFSIPSHKIFYKCPKCHEYNCIDCMAIIYSTSIYFITQSPSITMVIM